MKKELLASLLRVLVDLVKTNSTVERTRSADDSMDLITFFKQKLGEIGSVLSSYSCKDAMAMASLTRL